jgi:hypothetical protein
VAVVYIVNDKIYKEAGKIKSLFDGVRYVLSSTNSLSGINRPQQLASGLGDQE